MANERESREWLAGVMRIGPDAPSAVEKQILARRYRESGEPLGPLDDRFIMELVRLDTSVTELRERQAELMAVVERLVEPPWYPAILLELTEPPGETPRALVSCGSERRIVRLSDDVDPGTLAAGDEVYLCKEQNVIVGRSPAGPPRCGETAHFTRATGDGRLVVAVRDEEFLVTPVGSLLEEALEVGDQVRVERSSAWLAYEKVARSTGEHFFVEETPRETFAMIGGLDEVRDAVQDALLLRFEHAELARRYGVRPPGSILLEGPPGNGKTMFVRALANWLASRSLSGRARFINVKPRSLHSVWYSQTEANYRELFRIARQAGTDSMLPVVLYLDEIDAIAMTRGRDRASSIDDRVLTALMTELDGFEERGNVLIVAATNRLQACDPALLRPGRLGDLVIRVPRPNMAAAEAIFEKHLPLDAPYGPAGLGGLEARREIIAAVVSHLYAPNGDGSTVATLTFRNGGTRTVTAADLVSGASIAEMSRAALERACARAAATGEAGVQVGDLLQAAAHRCATDAGALTPGNCRDHIAGLPDDVDVVNVELTARRIAHPRAYLRAA
jgi:proteasome-associated ATPase